MASTRILSLALVDRNQLYVEYLASPEQPRAYLLPLNHKIGNREGQFDIGGVNFSMSARDIVLEGNILHAKLATSGHVWWDDQIAIDVELSPDPKYGEVPSIKFRRCDYLRLKRCRNLKLIDRFLLAAEYVEADGQCKEVYFDLKEYLGIKNGAFNRHGRCFLGDAQDVQLVGATLYANLKKTQRHISMEISSILQFKDGAVVPLRQSKSEDLDNELLIDISYRRHWLPNARNIRLLNYKQKRGWYLIADCLTPHRTFRESIIKIHEIIGPHDGEMFSYPSFADTSIPEHARETRLENGILTASFDAREGKWVERSFDLAELVTSEGGALTM